MRTQQRIQPGEVITLGREMPLGKLPDPWIVSDCQNPDVDRHSARFSGMIRAQIADQAANVAGDPNHGLHIQLGMGDNLTDIEHAANIVANQLVATAPSRQTNEAPTSARARV